jgi:uncharacterized protein
MNKPDVIRKTEEFVKENMKGDPGHDWSHIDRVRKNALIIAKKEKADLFIVEIIALLHDIGDYKFHKGNDHAGSEISTRFLSSLGLERELIKIIGTIVDNISFKSSKDKNYQMSSFEGKVVQDADRLDAMGAIGIARVFYFGGFKNKPMHDPSVKPNLNKTLAQYKKADNTSINHFYEKLLLLKDRMHTKTAKKIAERRHKFMEIYLKEFYREWNGL